MRRLILLRHAKAEPDAPSGRDRDRAINARGRADAAAMGAHIAGLALDATQVWLSPATRVQQTWALIAPHLPHAASETIEGLYSADCEDLLDALRGAPAGAQSLVVCGHNPTLHEAALLLVGEGHQEGRRALDINFPTCALCIIDFPIDDWADIGLRTGRLDRFVTPKGLREAQD